jgi:hypothetical protein
MSGVIPMKCLRNGYYEMRVVVAAEYVRHAEEQLARCGCFDAADYIQAVLNMALLSDIDRIEKEKQRNLVSPGLPEFSDDDMDRR